MPSPGAPPLSLHAALPISSSWGSTASSRCVVSKRTLRTRCLPARTPWCSAKTAWLPRRSTAAPGFKSSSGGSSTPCHSAPPSIDRKSTRLNSSYVEISYAVPRRPPSFPTRRSSDLVELGLDGKLTLRRIEEDASHALFAGTHAMVLGENGLASETIDGGARLQIELGRQLDALPLGAAVDRSEEHTSELQLRRDLVCRPPAPPLFPYTPLFRSRRAGARRQAHAASYRRGRFARAVCRHARHGARRKRPGFRDDRRRRASSNRARAAARRPATRRRRR